MSYEVQDAIVAYLDICGFTKFVRKKESDSAVLLQYLDRMMKSACKTKLDEKAPFKYEQFSDSIFFYYIVGGENTELFLTFLKIVGTVQYEIFVRYGLPVRGAVKKGRLSITGTVSGNIIVDVYKMESEKAGWFRVLLDKDLVSKIPGNFLEDITYRDDEYYALNFLILTSIIRNTDDFRTILMKFRDSLLKVIDGESENQSDIMKPCDVDTLGDFCEASIIENRYGHLIMYYNNICVYYQMNELCIDKNLECELVCTIIKQFKKHLLEYPTNKLALKNAWISLQDQFIKRKHRVG